MGLCACGGLWRMNSSRSMMASRSWTVVVQYNEPNVVEWFWREVCYGSCDVGCCPRLRLSILMKVCTKHNYMPHLLERTGDQSGMIQYSVLVGQ